METGLKSPWAFKPVSPDHQLQSTADDPAIYDVVTFAMTNIDVIQHCTMAKDVVTKTMVHWPSLAFPCNSIGNTRTPQYDTIQLLIKCCCGVVLVHAV